MSLWIFVLLVGAMNYEAVLVMPEMSDSKPPLVVFPHGNISYKYTSCLLFLLFKHIFGFFYVYV